MIETQDAAYTLRRAEEAVQIPPGLAHTMQPGPEEAKDSRAV